MTTTLRRNYIVARTAFGAYRYHFFTQKHTYEALIEMCQMRDQTPIATYHPCPWSTLPIVGAGIGAYTAPTDDVEQSATYVPPVRLEEPDDVLAFDRDTDRALSFVADIAALLRVEGDES